MSKAFERSVSNAPNTFPWSTLFFHVQVVTKPLLKPHWYFEKYCQKMELFVYTSTFQFGKMLTVRQLSFSDGYLPGNLDKLIALFISVEGVFEKISMFNIIFVGIIDMPFSHSSIKFYFQFQLRIQFWKRRYFQTADLRLLLYWDDFCTFPAVDQKDIRI